MSMGYRGKTTNAAREGVAVQAQREVESKWGEMTGTIVSFDKETGTAKVQPDYMPIHNGEKVKMAELEEIPVRFTRMGGFIITTPVKPGDKVTLRPQFRSTEEYHTGGDNTPVSDTRSYSLSDMEAFLDGGEPLTDPIKDFNNDNFEIRSLDGKFKMEMSENGKFKMLGAEGNWFTLLADVVDMLAQDTLQINHGSSSGGGHELQYRAQYAEIAAKLRAMSL